MNRSTIMVLGAYTWWGLSALFWRQLGEIEPIDQLAWRVIAALILLSGWWMIRRRKLGRPAQQADRKTWAIAAAAALLIATNWAVFLWAVSNDQAVDAALGYFLMPLVSGALGFLVLGEEIGTRRIVALALAATGVAWLVVVAGRLPIVAILLGITFAFYGLAKKHTGWLADEGLLIEVALIAPIMVVLLLARASSGAAVVAEGSAKTWALIGLAGLVTIVPLLLFATAAQTVPLVVIGMLQYLNPTLQFLVGWLIFGESVDANRMIGFGFVWVALAVIVSGELRPDRPLQPRNPGEDHQTAGQR